MADDPPDAGSASAARPENLGVAWSVDEERRLYDSFGSMDDIPSLASRHGRGRGGIRSRLVTLGLLDDTGRPVSPKPPFTPSASVLRRTVRSWRPGHKPPSMSEDTDAILRALLSQLGPGRRATAM